jgi:glucose/arabinose dehydrogenase
MGRPLLTVFAMAAIVAAQDKQKPVSVEITGHIQKPEQIDPTDERMRQLSLPPSFRIAKFAEKLGKPRMIAVADDGTVYVTRREPGDCVMLRDTNGDGRADEQKVVAQKPQLHGIAIDGHRVYLATVKELYVTERAQDGSFGALKQIIGDLPDGGQHPNRTIAVGRDRMLYVSVGSTCNECTETSKESATLLRISPDGTKRETFSSGLRNTIGFGWHPQTNELWGIDHGIDWLGDNEQGEEVNLLVQGASYGWPHIFGKSQINFGENPPTGMTYEQLAKMSREPALLYTAHAAPMQMAFYKADHFPAEYRNSAFIAMHGSWNRRPPSGYEVVQLVFRDGKPVEFKPFLTGFLAQQGSGWANSGRPTGLAVARDGSLLVSDDANGVIYRISYGDDTRSRQSK